MEINISKRYLYGRLRCDNPVSQGLFLLSMEDIDINSRHFQKNMYLCLSVKIWEQPPKETHYRKKWNKQNLINSVKHRKEKEIKCAIKHMVWWQENTNISVVTINVALWNSPVKHGDTHSGQNRRSNSMLFITYVRDKSKAKQNRKVKSLGMKGRCSGKLT